MSLFDVKLQDHEKIIAKLRQHWILLLWPTWKFLILTVLGAIPAFHFGAFFGNPIAFLLYLSWVMLAFNFWFHPFLEWYLNLYIITNKRVVNITHEGIFKRQITEASLHKVQDVTHKTLGMLSLIFNYGDVIVQTAGHHTLIHFHMVPKPREVHKRITELVSTPFLEEDLHQKNWNI